MTNKALSIFNQLRPVTVGFDNVFDHFERMMDDHNFNEMVRYNYPPYNIVKTGDYTYDIELALAGFNKKDIAYLDHVFLEALRINLSKVIGPMAEILIEDVVDDMKLKASEIPANQAAELINNLSLEIPDEKDRIEFKKSMLAILNKK